MQIITLTLVFSFFFDYNMLKTLLITGECGNEKYKNIFHTRRGGDQ